MNSTMNFMIVGVGGQGSLLASRVLGTVARLKNYDVKVSEVHGMAQRGGSVVTYVKMGDKVYSPIIEEDQADVIIAFEQLEGLRWINYLKKSGTMIVNEQIIKPVSVSIGKAVYPSEIIEKIKRVRESVISLDAKKIAMECGTVKAVNIVMMGVAAKYSGIEKDIWIEAIKQNVPGKVLEINLNAFEMGYVAY